jgi:hypothetical protein
MLRLLLLTLFVSCCFCETMDTSAGILVLPNNYLQLIPQRTANTEHAKLHLHAPVAPSQMRRYLVTVVQQPRCVPLTQILAKTLIQMLHLVEAASLLWMLMDKSILQEHLFAMHSICAKILLNVLHLRIVQAT